MAAQWESYSPISKTMNTIFRFLEPGLTSFIKNMASFVGAAITQRYICSSCRLTLKMPIRCFFFFFFAKCQP